MSADILIVDDEADIRMLLSGILEDEGYRVRTAHGDAEARRQVGLARPDLIFQDIWLQGSTADGIALLEEYQQSIPSTLVIMMSGHGTIETAVRAIKQGAYDFVEKPFNTDRLLILIQRALETSALKAENAVLRQKAGEDTDLIGGSHAIQTLRQTVDRVAPTNSRLMISGPPGAGKGLIARMMHNQSHRADQPFIEVPCFELDGEEGLAMLFGDAGTGQRPPMMGMIQQADGGTLLLDDVGDLSPDAQARLARFLHRGTLTQLGSTTEVRADVRIISTTNRDLKTLINESLFREDLYYRLNVVEVEIPGLASRPEDIADLARSFLDRLTAEARKEPLELGGDALAVLQAYPWPGNVRQLRNVMEWIVIMAPLEGDRIVRPNMLPPDITSEGPAVLSGAGVADLMSLPLRSAREAFERQYLDAQVLRFGGNITRTAKFVGMERSALHRKLRALAQSEEDEAGAGPDGGPEGDPGGGSEGGLTDADPAGGNGGGGDTQASSGAV